MKGMEATDVYFPLQERSGEGRGAANISSKEGGGGRCVSPPFFECPKCYSQPFALRLVDPIFSMPLSLQNELKFVVP